MTLYGLDISVHPEFRRLGIGRAFYEHRKEIVRQLALQRYATTCRLPDFHLSGANDSQTYCQDVLCGRLTDRTLTPLLRYGLTMTAVLQNHWDDPESGHAAAQLEWRP
jgi:GNAT superfamily N-acetyltransferase